MPRPGPYLSLAGPALEAHPPLAYRRRPSRVSFGQTVNVFRVSFSETAKEVGSGGSDKLRMKFTCFGKACSHGAGRARAGPGPKPLTTRGRGPKVRGGAGHAA